jgi:hypothetical protein
MDMPLTTADSSPKLRNASPLSGEVERRRTFAII